MNEAAETVRRHYYYWCDWCGMTIKSKSGQDAGAAELDSLAFFDGPQHISECDQWCWGGFHRLEGEYEDTHYLLHNPEQPDQEASEFPPEN